jgi:hypothetical protein
VKGADVQEFIQGVAQQLGIGTDKAKEATGGLLGMIQQHAPQADFATLLDKVPGAKALLPAKASGGGGVIGALGGALGGSLGGGVGKALGAADALGKLGLDAGKLGGFVGQFSTYLKPLLGGDLVKRLLASVPGIGALLK